MDDVLGKFAPPAAALFVVGVGVGVVGVVVVEQRQTTKLTACPLIFFSFVAQSTIVSVLMSNQ